jgi:hypothetical protein
VYAFRSAIHKGKGFMQVMKNEHITQVQQDYSKGYQQDKAIL